MEALTIDQQLYEIKQEWYEEAAAVKRNRSPIERQMALNHCDALLDAYFALTVEICYEQGKGNE